MTGTLQRVLVYPPVPPDPSVSWEAFGYLRPLDHARALEEHAALRRILAGAGAEVVSGEIDDGRLQDAIFAFDPFIVADAGAILGRMGKPLRQPEVSLAERTLEELAIPILGRITAPGTLEGGDTCWLGRETLLAGRSYRTNDEGIRQLREILAPHGVDVVTFDLPHWRGPAECTHLLTLFSLVDADLAVAYLPLLPARLAELFQQRGVRCIEVPEEEFASQATNVLALGPRRCLILEENVVTIERLRRHGCQVETYAGGEISHNRTGGPTCLTRPLLRAE
jgi:N-dimethylarginine dimethylaminohydrolase